MPSNHARDVAHHLGEASNALERLTTENAALQAEVERLKGEYDLACGLLHTSLENERRLIEEAKQATPPACDGEQPAFFLPEGCAPTLPPKITPLGASVGSAAYATVDAQPAAPDSQVSISEKLSASEPAESSLQGVCETAANISLLVSELQARLMTATQVVEPLLKELAALRQKVAEGEADRLRLDWIALNQANGLTLTTCEGGRQWRLSVRQPRPEVGMIRQSFFSERPGNPREAIDAARNAGEGDNGNQSTKGNQSCDD